MKKESLLTSMPKLILAIVLIVGIGAMFGMLGYSLTMPKSEVAVNNEIEEEDIEDEEIIQDETADRKTYRNEEFEFEFEYPKDWTIEEIVKSSSLTKIIINPSEINHSKPIIDGVVIHINKEYESSSIKDYLNKDILVDLYSQPQKFKKFIELFPDHEIILIDNKEGIQYKNKISTIQYKNKISATVTSTQKIIITVLPINKNIIEIIADEKYINVYNQILSTFKFIEKDETAEWQTYRNEEYEFEFKYPKDWGSPLVNNESKILFGCSSDDFESNKKCLLTLSFFDELPDINYRSKARIVIDNRNAEKYIGYGVCKSIFVISDYNDDNRRYKIALDYECSSEDENKILDWIISTFKFTKQLDVDSWNIYNDDNYGFQLKYPECFSVVDLDQIKNNISPFYQNWIQYIFEREYFGKPVILITSDKYGNFIVIHINKEDKGSECSKNDFLIRREGQMMSKETTVKEVISEVDFYKEEWREGTDGSHFFNYRTVYDDKCFMITTNLEDSYPGNPVKMELYDKIIHSFKFIEK